MSWLYKYIFFDNNFMPHSFCINHSKGLLITLVTSNIFIFLAYVLIPLSLAFFAIKRKDLVKHRFLLILFSLFILACSITHLLHVVSFWYPWYWIQAIFDSITAIISVFTAIYLWPFVPYLLEISNPEELAELNRRLEHEIEERKKTEALLKQESAIINSVLDSLPGIFYLISSDYRFIRWNHNLELYTGVDTKKMSKINALDLFEGKDKENISEKIQEVFLNGSASMEVEFVSMKNKHKQFYFTGKRIMIEGFPFLIGTGFDITDRKLTEKELRESQKLLRNIIDTSNDYIFVKDIRLHTILCNKIFAQAVGKQPSDLIGKSDIENGWDPELVKGNPEKGIKGYEQDDIAALNGSVVQSVDKAIIGKDVYYFDSVKIPIRNDSGEVFGLLGISRDITERKKMEDQLKSSSLYARSLIEASLDPLVTISSSGMIMDVNSATEKILGIPRIDIIGNEFSDYFTDPEKARIGYRKVFEQGFVIGYPLSIRHVSGKVTDVLYNASIYKNEQEEVLGVFAAARDITDLKKAEEKIKLQNLELVELNAAKDKFFSIIAHDLRSPFNGFLGLTKLIVEEFDEMSITEIKELSNMMLNSANTLFKLLENLLTWSRMQRGAMDFTPNYCAVLSLVNQNLKELNESYKQKNIEINIRISENIKVMADVSMLNSIFRNLISNAIKFTPRGGRVIISAEEKNDEVLIYVKDSGIGMNPDILSKLFKMDQKTARPGTEGESSTGLGLLLCKEFIDKHNGRIWVESEVEKGSIFYCTLPKSDFRKN